MIILADDAGSIFPEAADQFHYRYRIKRTPHCSFAKNNVGLLLKCVFSYLIANACCFLPFITGVWKAAFLLLVKMHILCIPNAVCISFCRLSKLQTWADDSAWKCGACETPCSAWRTETATYDPESHQVHFDSLKSDWLPQEKELRGREPWTISQILCPTLFTAARESWCAKHFGTIETPCRKPVFSISVCFTSLIQLAFFT